MAFLGKKKLISVIVVMLSLAEFMRGVESADSCLLLSSTPFVGSVIPNPCTAANLASIGIPDLSQYLSGAGLPASTNLVPCCLNKVTYCCSTCPANCAGCIKSSACT